MYKSATTSALIESDPYRRHKDLLKYSTLRFLAELKLSEATRPTLALHLNNNETNNGPFKSSSSFQKYMFEKALNTTLSNSQFVENNNKEEIKYKKALQIEREEIIDGDLRRKIRAILG